MDPNLKLPPSVSAIFRLGYFAQDLNRQYYRVVLYLETNLVMLQNK